MFLNNTNLTEEMYFVDNSISLDATTRNLIAYIFSHLYDIPDTYAFTDALQ